MTREELEFSISQYLDGDLAAGDKAALETRLTEDAEARALLDSYRSIDLALKAMPLPAVRWDALADQISAAVDQAEEPAQSYKIGFRAAGWLAAAASLVVATGVAVRVLQTDRPAEAPTVAVNDNATKVIRIVDSPTPEAPSVVVAIGPSDASPDRPRLQRYADEIVTRPSQVLIASSARPAQDIGGSPF